MVFGECRGHPSSVLGSGHPPVQSLHIWLCSDLPCLSDLCPEDTWLGLGSSLWGVCLACLDKEISVTWQPVGLSWKACGDWEGRTMALFVFLFDYVFCVILMALWPWPLEVVLDGRVWASLFLAFVLLISNTNYYSLIVKNISNAIDMKQKVKLLLYLALFNLAF